MLILEHVMPAKIKTIPKHLDDELKELGIDLIDTRPVIMCPYCFEMHGEEIPALQLELTHFRYHCGHCNLLVSLQ